MDLRKESGRFTSQLRALVPVAEPHFTLPELSFAYDELEPLLNEETMRLHHEQHHKVYVDHLNNALLEALAKGHPGKIPQDLDHLMAEISRWPKEVRDNGGGHWNHSFFWQILAPEKQSGLPSSTLQKAIERSFGTMNNFKERFEKAGTQHFGSGWIWLLVVGGSTLKISTTPNQDNPIMDLAEQKGYPILCCDLWEHAYYLQYQNRRSDFLKLFWKNVNWPQVNALFEKYREH